MKWHTEMKIPKAGFILNHEDPILAIGSCFSQEIGGRLHQSKFNIQINPFGTLYHPRAISRVLEYAMGLKTWTREHVTEQQGIWYSWDHHGLVSAMSIEDLEIKIENIHNKLQGAIKNTRVIVLTPGTAWGYQLKESGKIVANCHKAPGHWFEKNMFTALEVAACFEHIIQVVRKRYKDIIFVFTVSPVRHLKDGFHENQLSKSALMLGIQEVLNRNENVFYFPSYEIMMDELRDYRFYANDKIHPSEEAVEHIWERFRAWCMDENTRELILEVNKLKAQLQHKSFHKESIQHQIFLQNISQQLDVLIQKYPNLNWQTEIDVLNLISES